MADPPPFDQDEPRRGGARRPTAASQRPSGRPSGRRGAKPDHPGRSAAADGKDAGGGLPRWAVPAGAGVVVVMLLLVVLRACTGGGARSDAGACLTRLASHLPASATAVYGTDFVQASRVGWNVKGTLEEIGTALDETGVIPDPVTVEFRINRLATAEQFKARTGMAPTDVECALSDGSLAVLSGAFDPPAVNGSQAGSDGDLAATPKLLGMDLGRGDPKALLETAEGDGLAGDKAFVETLESLRDGGAYSVIVQRGDGKDGRALAAGVGAGGTKDDRTVEIAWVFAGEDQAKAGRPEMVNRINSVLKGTISITASNLVVSGNRVTATVPTRTAPNLQDLRLSGARLVDKPKD